MVILAFTTTLIAAKAWIRIAHAIELTGEDMHKQKKQVIAESGGEAAVLGIVFSLLAYIFLKTYVIHTETHLIPLFAIIVTLLLAGILGFIDDLIGWKTGLPQWQKPVLTAAIALPFVVISAGSSLMTLPVIGTINFGILYPLLIVPGGIIGAANAFNLLAGLNGLEAGQGIILLGSLSVAAYATQQYWLVAVTGIAAFSLLGFLWYNAYPSQVFPGDSLTYGIGALIAVVAITGDLQRIAVAMFPLYFLEFVLKARTRFQAESFLQKNTDGSVAVTGINSMTHVSVAILNRCKDDVREYEAVWLTWGIQAVISGSVLLYYLF
jgi:UDP-N-acetylglucosamine--dolichyl-phosphate N-acetylglucosaminephosphotransferase